MLYNIASCFIKLYHIKTKSLDTKSKIYHTMWYIVFMIDIIYDAKYAVYDIIH